MVALLLADGFEEIEALTPIDVLRRAGIVVRSFSINGDYCVCGAHDIMVDADDVIENIDYDDLEAVIIGVSLLVLFYISVILKVKKLLVFRALKKHLLVHRQREKEW